MAGLKRGLTIAGLLLVLVVGGWLFFDAFASGVFEFKHRTFARAERPIAYWGLLAGLAFGWAILAVGLVMEVRGPGKPPADFEERGGGPDRRRF